MFGNVKSNIVLKSDLEDKLESSWSAHNDLAQHVPTDQVNIYSAGFASGLNAIARAFGIDAVAPTDSQDK